MNKIQVNSAGGGFELIEERMREPAAGYVRVKVQACGVCHSDSFTKEGIWPGIVYPRSPGHEIAGVIDAVGEDAAPWKVGDRVGIGWHGGHCGNVRVMPSRRFYHLCEAADSGHQLRRRLRRVRAAPIEALARIPGELTPEEAAPLMCAGITTFNALRNSGARPGDWSQYRASADSDTWASSSRANSASRPSR